ncbi:cbb3-type cytochrome c oxidase N-terminal domain-containing protein [Halocola ammonii]
MKKLLFILSIILTLPLTTLAQADTTTAADTTGTAEMTEAQQAMAEAAEQSGVPDIWILVILLTVIGIMLLLVRGIAYSIADLNKRIEETKATAGGGAAKAILTILTFGAALTASAQPQTPNMGGEFELTKTMLGLLIFVIIFLFITILLMRRAYKNLAELMHSEGHTEVPLKLNIINSLHLTDRVDVDKEETVMLDHNYDGIRELDNNLPPWWKYMFYATIVFAVVYLVRFHVTGTAQLSHEEYEAEMAMAMANQEAAGAAEDAITEDNVTKVTDPVLWEKGEKIYVANCATCHGVNGGGGTGPNLTDQYWKHGGGIKNIFSTIKNGVPEKGMIPWESQLSPENIQIVASYIMSIEGTNPPDAKEPEGEIWVPEEEGETEETPAEGDSEETAQEETMQS